MSEEIIGHLRIVATGEVRDSDGNLISTEDVEQEVPVTESDLLRLGYIPPTEAQE